MVPTALLDAGNGAIFAATAVAIISVLQWTFSSPWWKDPLGSTVVVKDLCLLILLVPACVLLIWPGIIGLLGSAWLVVLSTGGIAVVMAWRCIVMFRIKRPWPWPPRNRAGTDKTK